MELLVLQTPAINIVNPSYTTHLQQLLTLIELMDPFPPLGSLLVWRVTISGSVGGGPDWSGMTAAGECEEFLL